MTKLSAEERANFWLLGRCRHRCHSQTMCPSCVSAAIKAAEKEAAERMRDQCALFLEVTDHNHGYALAKRIRKLPLKDTNEKA